MKVYEKIKVSAPKLNKFDLSHERKFSFNWDGLYPVLVQEVLPGDRFRVRTEMFMRLAPQLAPVMHRIDVYLHYFYVPNRLVWSEWEDFITGGRLGDQLPVHPWLQAADDIVDNGALAEGTLWDHMGLPTLATTATNITFPQKVSALPFRAYQLIYDEYYRDQNLEDSLNISLASGQVVGAELTKILSRQTRCWEKDYFTSCLPWAQRGANVLMPFAPDYSYPATAVDSAGQPFTVGAPMSIDSSSNIEVNIPPLTDIGIKNLDGTLSTIADLRRSLMLQHWLEKNALSGGRYTEQLLTHWGIRSDDARLQRPEYLGGGKQNVVFSEVVSTFKDASSSPQGEMTGHGVAVGDTNHFSQLFKEHGYVMGIVSVRPRTAYASQGYPRHMTRFDKLDYAWPEFAHIGEQEVKEREIWWKHDSVVNNNEDVFGYQARYAEYKCNQDSVHGNFRTTLSHWHLGRIFAGSPTLNASFVKQNASHRIFAVTDPLVDKLYCQLFHKIDALRPLPYFSTPGL